MIFHLIRIELEESFSFLVSIKRRSLFVKELERQAWLVTASLRLARNHQETARCFGLLVQVFDQTLGVSSLRITRHPTQP